MPVREGAEVDQSATVPLSTRVWPLAQIREGASIGEDCVVGRGAYIGIDVTVGNRCKIQNYALIYEPATLGDGVFIGPAAVLTNDQHPRAVNPDGSIKSASDWNSAGVQVGDGASIGARAVCVAPVRIGKWALVAAGAVVTRDVPDFALVAGVPARQIGWVGHAGIRLERDKNDARVWTCPSSGRRYVESAAGSLSEG